MQGSQERIPMVSQYFYKVLRRLFFNARLRGLENLSAERARDPRCQPCGLIRPCLGHHLTPDEVYPWVASEVTDRHRGPTDPGGVRRAGAASEAPRQLSSAGDRQGMRGADEGHRGHSRVSEKQGDQEHRASAAFLFSSRERTSSFLRRTPRGRSTTCCASSAPVSSTWRGCTTRRR